MRAEEIRAFRKQIRRFLRASGVLLEDQTCCEGLSLAQCHALVEIEEKPGITLGELAGVLGLDKSTLSRTVDSLVARGLVSREPHASDRRYNVHALTRQGAATLGRMHRASDERVSRAFDRIPVDDRRHVRECFGLLVEAMASTCKCRECLAEEESP